ncbi:MAG: PfkB family carbohydrate kinase [Acidobacteriota bacterium]|nr:PfkB family carbohydrate kinase [Acidobacteriota bacterium]
MRLLSIGEILWDIFPDGERLGGAALNFCAHLQRMGNAAWLLTSVGNDERGTLACQEMMRLGLSTEMVQVTEMPTGVAEITPDTLGNPQFVIPRPAAFDQVRINPTQLDQLRSIKFEWLYFGTLMQREPKIEWLTRELIDALPGVRCFYDMNLRTGHWNLPLVERLCRRANILKLEENEAKTLYYAYGGTKGGFTPANFCRLWSSIFEVEIICVTLGENGCYVFTRDGCYEAPGYKVDVVDTVGAGDAFAAAFLHGIHNLWPMDKTLSLANALGALVATRPGAVPDWTMHELHTMAMSPLRK